MRSFPLLPQRVCQGDGVIDTYKENRMTGHHHDRGISPFEVSILSGQAQIHEFCVNTPVPLTHYSLRNTARAAARRAMGSLSGAQLT
jgi:hypothetical protein